MRFSLGRVLIIGGVAVGIIGALAIALGLYDDLPPLLLKAAAYKMVGIAALGLIIAGAALRRLELQRRREPQPSDDARALPSADAGLDPAEARFASGRPRVREERAGRPHDR